MRQACSMVDANADETAPRGRARALMIRAAADLLQRRGYHGTGVAEILAQSGAPRGSLYHYFPGGKRQITVEAIAYAAQLFGRDIDMATRDAATVSDCCAALSALCKRDLLATNYEAGCPLAAVALDAPSSEAEIMAACDAGFTLWSAKLAVPFGRLGLPTEQAATTAKLFVHLLLGSTMAARVARDTTAIDSGIARIKSALMTG